MKSLVAGLALIALALPAHADTTLFQDNFDTNGGGLNTVPAGWTVTDGTVDVIGAGTGWDYVPGSGKFLDLDGTSGLAGTLSVSLNMVAGQHYSAFFDLAGSQVRNDAESVAVSFGAASGTYSLPRTAGWTHFALDFTPTSTGLYSLSFKNAGGDNVGMLLDNVTVTAAVPEPETYAMLLAGLGVVAAARRRKSRT
ncbi:PEP-CTERM sorting domain-containing protein [Niveibacterium microcysteis]|uniref:DUF642 domain-containing protein n=1 Tax=Niveibacterium microcysteis TaxID=2811415 RepID=A0ABX7M3S5_9RHOO|nr:PEP-CTERM sorting domain-containing protein [Niveibacterium microcysteis]QSI76404.1 DUF642 domain-containing protein [Niveibacterium microcysteis]